MAMIEGVPPEERASVIEREDGMSNLKDLADLPMLEIWGESVRARRLEGERISLAIVELAPNAIVPEHHHAAEQLGLCITGTIRFTLDGETRDLGPGGTWRITSGRPHEVIAGPDGAVLLDVFTPTRSDWDTLPLVDPPTPPRWPPA
jgi:quercetin dioxygenase-like cupin family protein